MSRSRRAAPSCCASAAPPSESDVRLENVLDWAGPEPPISTTLSFARATPYSAQERRAVIDALVTDPAVRAAAEAESAATNRPLDSVLDSIREYAEEIVPRYNGWLYHRIAHRVAQWIANAAYRVRVLHIDGGILREIPASASVVFVINHRSNADYVLVAFLAPGHVALSFAVGEWARIWPLDRLLRALGAFFVRRGSQNPLYRKVLQRYVDFAITHGVTQSMFPEGGLSKDGLLRPPKLGLLAYALKSFEQHPERDLVFVPVAVNYDRVLEDRTLLSGLDPAAPRQSKLSTTAGALRWIAKNALLYARGRWYRFGYACVNFGAPLSLASYLRNRHLNLSALDETERFAETEKFGGVLMEEIAHLIPATPVSLVASALITFDAAPATRAELAERVRALTEELQAVGAFVYMPRQKGTYLFDVGLRMLLLRRLVTRDGDRYRIAPNQRPVVAYYANSIAHFFATRDTQPAMRPQPVVARRPRAVILVHGLARTSRSMSRLGTRLGETGYDVYNWDYPSRKFGLSALVDMLGAYAQSIAPHHERIDFVTHSMGGLLVRGLLSRDRLPNIGRVVMLAPPNQGAKIASEVNTFAWARWFFGQALADLKPGTAPLLVNDDGLPHGAVGVIAGTRSFQPLQPTSYYSSLIRPAASHDGTVLVDETKLPGMADFVTINANHTFIMDHDDTIRHTLRFLEDGQFDHTLAPQHT